MKAEIQKILDEIFKEITRLRDYEIDNGYNEDWDYLNNILNSIDEKKNKINF